MEKLLQYVWKHKLLPLSSLLTAEGEEVEVVDPGMHNHDQGADFFNAKIRIGKTFWAGNVEVHLKSSDWFRHRHHQDPAYNNTILHVVETIDCEIETEDGKHPPQIRLDIPPQVVGHYNELQKTDDYPRCFRMIPQLDALKAHSWLDALLAERLMERSGKLLDRVKAMNGDWEHATFVTLCRNFGFGLNGDAFEMWAKRVPLQAVQKHRDSLFQIEAIFLGLAGLFDQLDADESMRMKKEFDYLSHKFELPPPIQTAQWKYLRTRPQNFPHVRLKQIARLYETGNSHMRMLLETPDVKALHRHFSVAGISEGSRTLLIINTVVPLLYAYGTSHMETSLQDKAIRILEQLPAENNYILRQWAACGLSVRSAADSQALIQLKREYCDRLDCLRCRFGYEYLKQK